MQRESKTALIGLGLIGFGLAGVIGLGSCSPEAPKPAGKSETARERAEDRVAYEKAMVENVKNYEMPPPIEHSPYPESDNPPNDWDLDFDRDRRWRVNLPGWWW